MEREVHDEGSERDTLALLLVAPECRRTCGREAVLSCSHTTPSIGYIGSSRKNFSKFSLSSSLHIQKPLIGNIGSSRKNFSEFCLSPSGRFENRSFQRLFLLFEIPVKMTNVHC